MVNNNSNTTTTIAMSCSGGSGNNGKDNKKEGIKPLPIQNFPLVCTLTLTHIHNLLQLGVDAYDTRIGTNECRV